MAAGFHVSLLVADGKGQELRDGVHVSDIGKISFRPIRMLLGPWLAFFYVIRKRPTLVHLHDPELLVVGLILRFLGVRVIYDAHEDLPEQIKRKHWIPRVVRKPTSFLAKFSLGFLLLGYDAVVTATDGIALKIRSKRVVVVKNYPILLEFDHIDPKAGKNLQFCYVGGITVERGAVAMIESLPYGPARLALAGNYVPDHLPKQLKELQNWDRVDELGFLSREGVAALYAESLAGVVVLQGGQGFEETLPIKLFEYMAASLPVICSDFPMWREIVNEAKCGLVVDDADMASIQNAYQRIISDPTEALKMGRRGSEAVKTKYNWDSQAVKLTSLYCEILRT